ncbi:hypothetical protein BI347_00050 [Chromobacterium sphagni]|uniref:Flagellar motor switch protein FliN n=1 Tax=Chromobacterium sphagni TaxID=1903179 RepID=A0A1S1WY33_9NEIS|nr:FliM/FliN family flagellar motor switch protein [Chromobacterium sphagni]OHX12059.1 hypothetical protein BI347_00050 [Chromobacterium sphagni]
MNAEVQIFSPEQLEAKPNEAAPGLLDGRLDLLKDVKVQLDTRLGHCQLSVAALNALKEGEVLTLDRMPGEPVDILLAGKVVARGSLVVAGDYFGVRIEEVAQLTV